MLRGSGRRLPHNCFLLYRRKAAVWQVSAFAVLAVRNCWTGARKAEIAGRGILSAISAGNGEECVIVQAGLRIHCANREKM